MQAARFLLAVCLTCLTPASLLGANGPNLTCTLSVAVEGQSATYTMTVKNSGNQAAGLFFSTLWHNLGAPPTSEVSSDDEEYEGLAAGQSVVRTYKLTNTDTDKPLPMGLLQAWFMVDSGFSFVDETNESDNLCGPVAYSVGDSDRADLVVTEFTVDVNQDVVTFHAVVTNQGAVDAGSFDVDVFKDRVQPPVPGEWGDGGSMAITSLAAGESLPVAFPPIAMPDGTYHACLLLDTGQFVTELSEDNNVSCGLQYKVEAQVTLDKPDLIIATVQTEDTGDSIHYTVTVKNVGTRDAGPFDVGVYTRPLSEPSVSDQPDLVDSIDGLKANAQADAHVFWSSLENGTFHSWAIVDTGKAVDEINEKNNTAGPYEVVVEKSGLDLAASGLTWDWSASQELSYDFTVTNLGQQDASGYDVHLFFDLDRRPDKLDPQISQVPVKPLLANAPLAKGESRTHHVVWDLGLTPGLHQSWVAVDLFGDTGDVLTSNNVAGPLEVTIPEDVGQPPDLRVEEFAVQADGFTLEILCRIKNVGARSSGPFKASLYLAQGDPPGVGQAGDVEVTVANLDPQADTLWTPTWVALEDTDFNVWLMADSEDAVQEANEANNLAGPIPVPVKVVACQEGVLLEGDCVCGLEVARVGEFCCPGELVSTVTCQDVQAEWDAAEEPEASGSGGCAVSDAGPSQDGWTATLLLGCLLAYWQLCRRLRKSRER
jgi:subtilase family serine protease